MRNDAINQTHYAFPWRAYLAMTAIALTNLVFLVAIAGLASAHLADNPAVFAGATTASAAMITFCGIVPAVAIILYTWVSEALGNMLYHAHRRFSRFMPQRGTQTQSVG